MRFVISVSWLQAMRPAVIVTVEWSSTLSGKGQGKVGRRIQPKAHDAGKIVVAIFSVDNNYSFGYLIAVGSSSSAWLNKFLLGIKAH